MKTEAAGHGEIVPAIACPFAVRREKAPSDLGLNVRFDNGLGGPKVRHNRLENVGVVERGRFKLWLGSW